MSTTLHVIDAFTREPFAGNPAAVCVLPGPADEGWMRRVARELNLAETAFLHPIAGGFALRWLTPAVEVDLCGHATLAAAFTLWQTRRLPRSAEAVFQTRSGRLSCRREGDWIAMDFPAQPPKAVKPPAGLAKALGAAPVWTGFNGTDYFVEVTGEKILRGLAPDFGLLARLRARGVVVTCAGGGEGVDFQSRFFAPAVGVNEDPATGSSHCALGPFWGARLGKAALTGYQASERGGLIRVEVRGDRVVLRGQAVRVSRVTLFH